MSDQKPSPMLVYLDDALEKALPETDLPRLNAHDPEVAKTTGHGDLHRCLRCAEWAVHLASRPGHSHLENMVQELKAVLHEARDTDWAEKFGRRVSHHPVLDVELSWVDDAVAAAQAAAQTSGWESVPWEDLLIELIAMEPDHST